MIPSDILFNILSSTHLNTISCKKHKKAEAKPAATQKAQAAKKHKKAAAKPVAQKAQAAKKHHKTTKHHTAKPAAQPAA